jgi:hypothetical protein
MDQILRSDDTHLITHMCFQIEVITPTVQVSQAVRSGLPVFRIIVFGREYLPPY